MAGFVGFILGTVLGSFSLALAHRSLSKRSFWGRSYCPHCKKKLQWYDLTPIVSYIILFGKCRYCGEKIGIEYFLVEVIMGVLIGYLFLQSFSNLFFKLPSAEQFFILNFNSIFNYQFLIFLIDLGLKTFFIVVLVSLFLTDLKKMLIPDRIIIPSIVIAVILNLSLTLFKVGYLYFYLSKTLIGKYLLPPYSDYFRRHALMVTEPFLYSVVMALLIGGFFFSLIVITKGKGMGGGDVKLGAFMGLMLGFPNALVATFLSFIIGAVFSIILIILGKKSLGQTIPFGPFLVAGSLIALFWGNQLLGWYLTIGF